MSVIREQIFQALAAFQEQPIRCHYPSLSVFLFSGLGPFVSHKSYTAIYWRWFIWGKSAVLVSHLCKVATEKIQSLLVKQTNNHLLSSKHKKSKQAMKMIICSDNELRNMMMHAVNQLKLVIRSTDVTSGSLRAKLIFWYWFILQISHCSTGYSKDVSHLLYKFAFRKIVICKHSAHSTWDCKDNIKIHFPVIQKHKTSKRKTSFMLLNVLLYEMK